MKKILVPTDFSPLAEYAMQCAAQLAGKTGAELVLLHVVEMPGAAFSVTGQDAHNSEFDLYTLKLIAKTKKDLKKITDKYNQIKITSDLQVGNAYQAIAQIVADQEVDLVIMGSHGADGWEEVFVGSNAEKVVRRAKCPVLVLKGPFDLEQAASVAFAADFEEESGVIENLKTLQSGLNLKLHLVKINTPNNFSPDHQGMKVLKDFAKQHQLENYTLNIYNDYLEESGIRNFAQEVKADLIAMGTHGRTGLQQLLTGSIAENVVNHSECPVWTCRIVD